VYPAAQRQLVVWKTAPMACVVEPTTGQALQDANPASSLYFPMGHGEQFDASGPSKPTLHRQFASNVLPALKLREPLGHVWQFAGPVPVLYEPARQAVQAAPFAPVKPALQMQALTDELACGETLFPGQAMHLLMAVSSYCPAGHTMQTSDRRSHTAGKTRDPAPQSCQVPKGWLNTVFVSDVLGSFLPHRK